MEESSADSSLYNRLGSAFGASEIIMAHGGYNAATVIASYTLPKRHGILGRSVRISNEASSGQRYTLEIPPGVYHTDNREEAFSKLLESESNELVGATVYLEPRGSSYPVFVRLHDSWYTLTTLLSLDTNSAHPVVAAIRSAYDWTRDDQGGIVREVVVDGSGFIPLGETLETYPVFTRELLSAFGRLNDIARPFCIRQ